MGKYHILVIDENQKSAILFSSILKRNLNCRVSVANDGYTAIRLAKDQVPDLILLDLMMPDFDGLQTVTFLKADNLTKGIPVIMITGISEQEGLIKAYEAGVTHYITKPFVTSEMLARVKSALRMNETLLTTIDNLKKEIIKQSAKTSHKERLHSYLLLKLKEYERTYMTDAPKSESLLTEIIMELESNTFNKSWNQLDILIQHFEPLFFYKLKEKHQNLTPSEIKLCYLLRLNMSTKDISNLVFKTQEVVHLSRIRLRKKLLLSRIVNLSGYLLSF